MGGGSLGEPTIKAVVFDLDGTLIRSTVDFRNMKERMIDELAHRGVPVSILDKQDTIVNNLSRVFSFLRSEGREAEIKEIDKRVTELMNSTELERVDQTTPVPGASEALRELRGLGLKLGLLTRGSREYALAALRYAGLSGEFEAMVCRDDHPEEEAKPNGKALHRVAAILGVRTEECLLVGDHLIDLNCARSASARFLGVLTGVFKADDWRAQGAPAIESVADLPGWLRAHK